MARPVVKKQDIENAAISLFSTKGLARTTIKDIAREAGVTEGALYRHYSGKNEMAWQLFCQELAKFSEGLGARMFNEDATTSQRVEQGVRYIFSYYEEYTVQFAFIMLTQHGFPEEKVLTAENNPNDMAVRFVQQAIEAGEVHEDDPVLMAGLVMGLILQPLVMHQYNRLTLTPAVVDSVIDATRRVLRLK